jgi:hypothetical protein
MSRTHAARLAVVESCAWLRWFQQAIEQAFTEAAEEAGVDATTHAAITQALQQAHRAYPTPPPGWYDDYEETFVVADAHITQTRGILDRYLTEHTTLAAVCRGMHDRLKTLAQGADDATV